MPDLEPELLPGGPCPHDQLGIAQLLSRVQGRLETKIRDRAWNGDAESFLQCSQLEKRFRELKRVLDGEEAQPQPLNLTSVRRQILTALARSKCRLTQPGLLTLLKESDPDYSEHTLRIEVAAASEMRQAGWIDHEGKGNDRGYGITTAGREALRKKAKPL